MPLPKIVSVDDHVVEPAGVWQDRLPRKWLDEGPRLERRVGWMDWTPGAPSFIEDDSPASRPVDVWRYEDTVWPLPRGFAQVGSNEFGGLLVTYENIVPGAYQQRERLADMDANGVEASLCFPTFPRESGQRFLHARDRELALACVQIYNDWLIDEWCGGDGRGRLIPVTLIPLWDAELAAAEIWRCADKGSHAITFHQQPADLGLPSIHSGRWDPVFGACEETQTVINIHLGSVSRMPVTAPDAPDDALETITIESTINAFVDWMLSGVLERHRMLRVAFSEGQAGWMPFFVEQMDKIWERNAHIGDPQKRLPRPPSEYLPGRVYASIFDDVHSVVGRPSIGMGHLMVEVDYPHDESTFPHTTSTIEKLVQTAGLSPLETRQLLRGNAIECYGLERNGIIN